MSVIPKLDLDNRYLNKTNKTAFHNRNIVLDKGGKAIKNEDGFSPLCYIDYKIIGIIDLPTGFIVFSTDNTTSEIGVYSDDVYVKKLVTAHLHFKLDCPIEGVAKYNAKGELVISWWNGVYDNSTAPKLLNLDDLPFPHGLTGGLELVESSEITLCDISPDYVVPNFDISIGSGGRIAIGQYSFVIAYQFNINDITNWCGATRFIPISDIKHDIGVYTADLYDYSDDSGLIVSKTINLHITNLDVNFPFFKLGVISKINGVSTFSEVGTYTINDITATADVIFDGSVMPTDLTLAAVTTPSRIFKKVKTGCINNRRLVFGNITVRDSIDYQKYANNINVEWTTSLINGADGADYYFKKGEAVFYLRNFKPDEVEALYGYFTFTDGSVSEAFHIPGRIATTFTLPSLTVVNETASIPYNAASRFGDGVNANAKYFHIFNTGVQTGFDASFLPYGTMGYWENKNEYYPSTDDFDVWGIYDATLPNVNPTLSGDYLNFSTLPLVGGLADSNYVATLQGTKVRHHKFPAITTLIDLSPTVDVELVLGIRLSQIAIPPEIQNKVQSFNLAFAKRGLADSTVIGDSVLTSEWLGLYGLVNCANYGFYDFDLLCARPAISPIYIKRNYSVTAITGAKNTYLPGTDIHDQIDVISSYEYVPAVAANGMINNFLRLVPKVIPFPYIPALDSGFYDEASDFWNVGTLHQFKENVFNKFYEQDLIPLGYNFDISSIITLAAIEYEPNAVYRIHGGDCFLSKRGLYIDYYDTTLGHVNFQPQIVTYQYANYQYRSLPPGGTWTLVNDNDINDDWYALMSYFAPSCYNTYSVHNSRFPYQISRSTIESNDGISENWRTFLVNDKYEMHKTKGEIWGLCSVNRTLCINQKYSFYIAKLKDTLSTPGGVDAYLGEGDIFDREPNEILSTNEGYAGCQSQFARFVYPGGYGFCDKQQGKIFIFNGEQLSEISAIGLRDYFSTNLTTIDEIDNPFTLFGLTATYDDINKRIIFSKKNIVLASSLTWQGEYNPNTTYVVNDVMVADGIVYYYTPGAINVLPSSLYTITYLTLSYHIINECWVSWHDYAPNFLFYNRNGVYSVLNGLTLAATLRTIFKHNITTKKGAFYNNEYHPYCAYIDVIFNEAPTIAKLYEAITWQTDVIHNEVNKWNDTFTHIMIYNDTQCSDIIELNADGEWFDAMTGRTIHDSWYFNNFRDCTLDNTKKQLSNNNVNITFSNNSVIGGDLLPLNPTHPDVVATPTLQNVNKLMKEYFDLSNIISKFAVVRLIYDNRLVSSKQSDIFINDVDIEVSKSSI